MRWYRQRLGLLCDTTPLVVWAILALGVTDEQTSENKPNRAGVVRTIANSDHCRCVSPPNALALPQTSLPTASATQTIRQSHARSHLARYTAMLAAQILLSGR